MKPVVEEVRRVMEHAKASSSEDFERFLHKTGVIKGIFKIPGDASTRKYYRISTRTDKFILQVTEPFYRNGAKLDFLEVQGHLAECGVDVPRVYDFDPKMGFVLMEDLGDTTLLHQLKNVSDTRIERDLYKRVIDQLVLLHVYASTKQRDKKIQAFNLDFNFKKLMWEVNFTLEHFYDKHLQRKMRPKDRRVITEGLAGICRTLAKEPKVFTHRDFHSRNIMIQGSRIVMIDFQDARMGPKQYDLASLLRDSYYQLEEAQVQRLALYYFKRWQAVSGEKLDRQHFFHIFDLMGIQRNFKAIGSFASFLNRRKNPTYLKYIGNTFENIRRVLLRYPEYSSLREVLYHYYYF